MCFCHYYRRGTKGILGKHRRAASLFRQADHQNIVFDRLFNTRTGSAEPDSGNRA
jgi:hypothetical protein